MRYATVVVVLLLAACRNDTPPATPRSDDAPRAASRSADASAPVAPLPASLPAPPDPSTGLGAIGDALPPPDLGSTSPPTDAWLGKWIGPEGTLLTLSRNRRGYDVAIESLDGPATYAGVPVGDHVEFTRAGKRESIVAGNGAATGMKWLADKRRCLVIRAGEGFCRD